MKIIQSIKDNWVVILITLGMIGLLIFTIILQLKYPMDFGDCLNCTGI